MALCFLNCRAGCRSFDNNMLAYLSRFIMRPVRALACDPVELSIEFLQRELVVSCLVSGFSQVKRILFAEYRFYNRQALATNRALVRKPFHEATPGVLQEHDPKCLYWADLFKKQLAGEALPRHNVPWYLPESAVRRFHEHCTQAINCAACARAFELANPPLDAHESQSGVESD